MAWLHRNFRFCSLVVSVFLAASALADEPGAVSWDAPTTNHPTLLLSDGRVLVAGGMAISGAPPEYEVGADSEMWDPRSGEWRTLNSGISFEPDQRVYLNQLADGRVLFFAVRSGGKKAEYQARTWDPEAGSVEKLLVGMQPESGVDVAVLSDGKVLIVNGAEGVADLWSSRTNSLVHFDEPLLRHSRWRVFPLHGAQVLLVETFPDDADGGGTSRVLSWNLPDGERGELARLPARFTNDSSLSLRSYGGIQAGIGSAVYTLPVLDGGWEIESGKALSAQAPGTGVGSQSATPAPEVPKAPRWTAVEPSWKQSYMEKVREDLKWVFVFVPIMLTLLVARSNDNHLPYMVRSSLAVMLKWLVAVFFVLVGWILLRHGPIQVAQAQVSGWWYEYREGIAALVLVTAIFGPIPTYFLLRRMEEEKQKRFLARASMVARTVLVLFIIYVLVGSAVEEYGRVEQGGAGGNAWQKVVAALDRKKWVALAILVPAGLYFLLRRLEADKLERLTRYANRAMRVAALCFLASLPVIGMYANGQNELMLHAADCHTGDPLATVRGEQLWAQCIDDNSGMIARLLFNKTKEHVMSLPAVPCDFVGVWTSSRQDSKYQVTLTDDSRFVVEPIHDGQGRAAVITGIWGARDGEMIWFEDGQSHWPIDVNPVLREGKGYFRLVEVNGELTEFRLVRELGSRACSI